MPDSSFIDTHAFFRGLFTSKSRCPTVASMAVDYVNNPYAEERSYMAACALIEATRRGLSGIAPLGERVPFPF